MEIKHKIILVADDEEFILLTYNSIFTKHGYIVINAKNGEEAMGKIAENKDITHVLSDLDMPRGNGLLVLAYAKTKIPNARLFLNSGNLRPEILEDVEELGATAFQKPVSIETFKEVGLI